MKHATPLIIVSLALLVGCTEEDPPPDPALDGGPPPALCSAGEKRCLNDTYKECAADGMSWKETDCAAASQRCLVFSGVPSCTDKVCVPGAPGCAADGITTRTCAADGSKWVTGKKCAVAAGELCFTGKCEKACARAAKNQQSEGCVFYPVNLQNESADTVGVVVSNPNQVDTTVKLYSATALMKSQKVKAGALATFLIKPGVQMLKGTGKKKAAFKLVAPLPIAAYQFSPLNKAEQRSNDASMLIPRTSLGKRYYLIGAPVTRTGSSCYVTVVGTAAKTTVTVTPAMNTEAGGGIPLVKSGKPYKVVLGDQEILQLSTGAVDADLTGTLVSADKPVAVFSGHTCANLPKGKTYCDHVQEQMFPMETWGNGYLAAKFMPRGKHPEDDWWRVVAGEESTTITIQGAPALGTTYTLGAGQYYNFSTSEAFVIKGDKPFTLGHNSLGEQEVSPPADPAIYTEKFQTTKGCTQDTGHANLGDPALAVAVPWAQYRDAYNFLVPDTYRYDFITLLFPAGVRSPDVILDGKPQSLTFKQVGATGLTYARLRVTDGPHKITASHKFGIEVYGYDCNVSYAFSGGNNLRPINPVK